MDLRHRLPALWGRVQAGDVAVWVARKVAEKTRRLSAERVLRLDARLVDLVGVVATSRLLRTVDAAVMAADLAEARSQADRARSEQGVWVSHDLDHGYATLVAKAPAVDLAALGQTLDHVANALAVLGDGDDRDLLRARALTLLANPQAVLDVIAAARDRLTSPTPGDPRPRRRLGDLGTAIMYVHLTDQHLTDQHPSDPDGAAAVVRVEDVGPALLDQVRDWVGHRNVVVKPVIDIPGTRPVDCYEVPDAMAEALRLRTPASPFPYSANVSRSGDNDHTIEYVPTNKGGPPGQTGPPNLARMPRFEHRVKTFADWTMRQPRSGCFLWRSPHGYWFLVDEHGTHNLGKLV